MEKLAAWALLFYLIVGFVSGIITVLQIIITAKHKGLNKTSKSVLDMGYGGDYGSTVLSLFLFPFFLTMMLWPFILFIKLSNRDRLLTKIKINAKSRRRYRAS